MGIIFRGFILTRSLFESNDSEALEFKKGAFFSAISSYTKNLFSEDLYYIEATNHIISFNRIIIKSYETNYEEELIGYAIFDVKNRKKTEKVISKKIKPILTLLLGKFKEKYNRKNFMHVNKFNEFSREIEIAASCC